MHKFSNFSARIIYLKISKKCLYSYCRVFPRSFCIWSMSQFLSTSLICTWHLHVWFFLAWMDLCKQGTSAGETFVRKCWKVQFMLYCKSCFEWQQITTTTLSTYHQHQVIIMIIFFYTFSCDCFRRFTSSDNGALKP